MAAANPSTSDLQLLQIEEPAEDSAALPDRGLALGLELTATGLVVAISVGGNVECVPGPAGEGEMLAHDGAPGAAFLQAAGRRLLALTGRPLGGAVLVHEPETPPGPMAEALIEAGWPLLTAIETPVAIGWGLGLDARPGRHRVSPATGADFWLETSPSRIRFDGWVDAAAGGSNDPDPVAADPLAAVRGAALLAELMTA